MVAAKRLVASTPQGALRLLGTGGTYALRSHTQIRQYLRASLGEEYAQLFAEPSFDNANGRIDWLAEVDEQPVPLTQLAAEQAEPLRKQLAEKRQRIAELAETLSRREQQSAILLGELLRQALSYPNEDSVLAAGQRLVLINWGAAVDRSEAEAPTTKLTAAGRAAVAAPVAVAPVAATTVVVAERRTAAYWLWSIPLWILFAALMAGIYYYLLEACAVSGVGPEDDSNPFISFCPGKPVAAAEPPPELAAAEADGRVLREKLNQLEIQIAEARRQCPVAPVPAPGPAPGAQ
ncbi:MAG TPA: hypothetical protein VJL84_02735 [Kiloniellales bacterium]|nr:hypothetical protein [Kiloniellales bacterium]